MTPGEATAGMALLNRAFLVLDAFCRDSEESLTLAQLSARVGLPKTTVHRLLGSLLALGAVERSGDAYQLGMRMFEIGEHVPGKRGLREAALPFMEDLYEVTHETVHLAVLDGTEVLYVERIRGHNRHKQLPSRVGGRLPAYCTGVGKALLAFNPEAAAVVARSAPLAARTPYTITGRRLLLAELGRVRRHGVAVDREESALGIHCVAAPIVAGGVAVAAISVTGTAERISEERFASAVRTAGLGLQRTLARPGPDVS